MGGGGGVMMMMKLMEAAVMTVIKNEKSLCDESTCAEQERTYYFLNLVDKIIGYICAKEKVLYGPIKNS